MPRRIAQRTERRFVDRGVEIVLPKDYTDLERSCIKAIRSTVKPYPKATRMYGLLVGDPETRANWDMADYIAVTKLNYNDHGEVHAKVVAANAVSMLAILAGRGISPDVVSSGAGDLDDAFLVVLAGALLHDVGNQIHRVDHPLLGLFLAMPVLDRLMPQVYDDVEKRVELRSFILSSINSHGLEPEPLTLEAGLVAVGDGCDMTKGRGRIAFDLGNINIHTVSALSIDSVTIAEGKDVPIEIIVGMSNSAGIFQVDESLAHKVLGSPLRDYVRVMASTRPAEALYDVRIVHQVVLKGKQFTIPQATPIAEAAATKASAKKHK